MFALRSLVLTAISLFVCSRIDFANAYLFKCILPQHFATGVGNQSRTDVYGSQLSVTVPVSFGFAIFKYPGTNTITFKVNGITVKFTENVVLTVQGKKKTPPKFVSQESQYRIEGVAQRVEINSTDSDISDCHLFLLPIGDDSHNVTSEMASEIRRLAESCVHSAICLQIGKMNGAYRPGPAHTKGLAKLPGLTGPNAYSGSYFGPTPFQNAINTFINDGLRIFVNNLKGQPKIHLPKINFPFKDTKPYNTKGHLVALNGTIDSLTNVMRTSPPALSHDGLKFTVSDTFALNLVKLSYNYRWSNLFLPVNKLKHGFKSTKGDLTALIDAVNLDARFSVDYSAVPCETTLDHLKVTSFDNIQPHFTNGALKTMDNKREWFDKKARDGIAQTIEEVIRDTSEIRLWNFDCEMYRP